MNTQIISITGEEPFLIDEYLSKVISSSSSHSIDTLPPDISLNDLHQHIMGSSLFSPASLFIIKSPWFLKQTLTDNELDHFKSILLSVPQSPHKLVFIYYGALDLRKKITKLLKSHSDFQQFSAFKDWDQNKVLAHIPNIAQSFGKKITREGTWTLEQIHGQNLQHIKQTLETVATYIGTNSDTITDKDILSLSPPLAASSYKFTEAMKQRQLPAMIKHASLMLENGEDPIRFLGLIASNLRLFLQLFAGQKAGLRVDAIATELKKNAFYLKKVWEPITSKYTLADIQRLFSDTALLDRQIKSGKIKATYGVEHLLISFSK